MFSKIAEFLNIKISDSHLKRILHDSNVKQMKQMMKDQRVPWLKESAEFVRKGQSSQWKKYFTVEQNEWFDKKYKKLYAELPGIDVHYE